MTFFYGSLHIDVPVLADQQELTYIISAQTKDLIWKWRMGERQRERERERERVKEMFLWALLEDDDDMISSIPIEQK